MMTALGLTACSGDTDVTPTPDTTTDEQTNSGALAVFLPTTGFTLNDSTPIISWDSFASYIRAATDSMGFDSENVTVIQSRTAVDQHDRLENYLEETGLSITQPSSVSSSFSDGNQQTKSTNEATVSPSATTIVLIPVGESTADSRRCSDLITRGNDVSFSTSASSTPATPLPSSSMSSSVPTAEASSPDTSETTTNSQNVTGESENERIAHNETGDLLRMAQSRGASIITSAEAFTSFTPTLTLALPTPRSIGRLQAQLIVSKLRLAATDTTTTPRAIEVLLPYDDDPDFAREAFTGIWSVLDTYFASGRAYSPSGLLTAASTADSWRAVAFVASDTNAVKNELTKRLDASENDDIDHIAIDAVLCMNDMSATGAVAALKELGYTGTSATINPGVTLPGVIDVITGRKDVSKSQVPAPAPSSSTDTPVTPSDDGTPDAATVNRATRVIRVSRDDAAWPLITGYGCYKSVLPNIVDGTQWASGIEDAQGYASDCVKAAFALNQGTNPADLGSVISSLTAYTVDSENTDGTDEGKITIRVITRPLSGVHADNIKGALIDKGYATAADAGL